MSAVTGVDEDEEDYIIDVPDQSFHLTQFHEWYSKRAFNGKSIRSVVVDLPASFITYLGEDGIIIPESLGGGESDPDDIGEEEDSTANVEAARADEFQSLNMEVTSAIEVLGGEVFPKLNWTCPLDAAWMNAGSLKCFKSVDVWILLKSSDRITYDVSVEHAGPQPEATATKKKLVLRKWANLNPSMEFRFFVRGGALVGLCQRDCYTYYEFLAKDEERERIEGVLLDFFYTGYNDNHYAIGESSIEHEHDEHGEDWVASAIGLRDFTLDVYVDKRDRVWIVDFNVYGPPTDPLLYSWRALDQAASRGSDSRGGCGTGVFNIDDTNPEGVVEVEHEVTLKVVSSELERVVRRRTDVSCHTGPIDVTEAPDFHQNWEEILRRQRQEDEAEERGALAA